MDFPRRSTLNMPSSAVEMTLAELKAVTISEIAKKKAEEDAIEQKKQAEEFGGNAEQLKSQLEKHLPVQLIKEYGVEYKIATSSNALVVAMINYRGAEILIWQSPASNWTHWDVDCKNIASHKGVAGEDLTELLLVKFIDAIDKALAKYLVKLEIEIELESFNPDVAIDTMLKAVDSMSANLGETDGNEIAKVLKIAAIKI